MVPPASAMLFTPATHYEPTADKQGKGARILSNSYRKGSPSISTSSLTLMLRLWKMPILSAK